MSAGPLLSVHYLDGGRLRNLFKPMCVRRDVDEVTSDTSDSDVYMFRRLFFLPLLQNESPTLSLDMDGEWRVRDHLAAIILKVPTFTI